MMIPAYSGPHIGSTGFFRNRALLDTVHDCVDRLCPAPPRVLFHAVSIGAEAYSYVIGRALRCPEADQGCDATDISLDFHGAAGRAIYPATVCQGMTSDEARFFEPAGVNNVHVAEVVRRRVRLLPPASYVEFETDQRYDVVFLLNLLLYVDAAAQRRTFDRIARYNTRLLITTGFHPDTIKVDLSENGYQPITTNIAEIHEGWTERRILPPGFMVQGQTHCRPALPTFSPIADYEYKYCAIFEKKSD
ncbi:MAG: hypothetical protein EXQ98_05610 [Alphaproteobacteria bacterium]|nr:hypothetical protein [Alphaproteobacteria bacterium]